MRTPISTYRFQVRESFDLAAVAEQLPYVKDLGADWVYLSPILAAEPGSDHGYDVVDHSQVDPSRGGAAGMKAVADRAHELGLGVLVDIVPNHVGVATPVESLWWWDLLTHGTASRYADAFDVDWDFGQGKVRIPVLGDGETELDELTLVRGDDGTVELRYYDQRFPVAPGTAEDDADARTVHERQSYELINWRRADAELNYRRFFAVNTLAGIRVELPRVFEESHAEISRWFREGLADGLRVDHPDGLLDPKGYLDDLARITGGAYVLVEKILEPGETLPTDWATAGTTGYDALAEIDRVLVDPDGQVELDHLEASLRGLPQGELTSWADMIRGTKRGIADGILRSEVLRLERLVEDAPADAADALAELLATFPVYRSYLPGGLHHLEEAAEAARASRPDLVATIDALMPQLSDPSTAVAQRFQQTSGMVMAKGVEDTAFYRYSRLVSLNEVGADPSIFAIDVDDFHARQQERHRIAPHAMTTLSTHDTKRGEDVRARIDVLSETPEAWRDALGQLREVAPTGDGPFENLLWQTLVGTWPASRERLHAYAEKASREAGDSTTWTAPDEAFEERMHALVDAAFDDPRARTIVAGLYDRLSGPGWSNSLAAKAIQLTAPGMPDVYQGSELWETSLVDPDNRREVDFGMRRAALDAVLKGAEPAIDETGAAKLLVTARALRLRREHPELFTGYEPVRATGDAAAHVIAFDRGGAITVATRLPVGLETGGGWGSTTITLPEGELVDHVSGRRLDGGRVSVAALLADYPVAILAPASTAADLTPGSRA
ncbi:malto-oligosyltrehalose synthase [Clavibacter michiganensis]|uniref:malto-oligosyltrehalose synthase n=1 Tax=Clavibacter michiganensis TaxID=28447 RepID=UPI000A3620FC|nr:malto-oligosyltrehalose synthase [Clavibacter michiganensis]MDO4100380.1 malto-oligosyltrehalose synthase [Clavibacter michiganensis]MDO4126786.1 malto-oligosyltrehalose synthase [Clavibacter michiganensis]MWJ19441.1 malto-oligosyltrehalose synthase [Clavibacter michiganensis subsp. michiganensis]NIY60326.1 malto-oligosyltrehalose synthase [Clavibacter michiganensis subsp. michiganensis]OUD99720.1 Maltooligosyl trehalose synthase [Clavibacter michiganensis subsp. michiganensis]